MMQVQQGVCYPELSLVHLHHPLFTACFCEWYPTLHVQSNQYKAQIIGFVYLLAIYVYNYVIIVSKLMYHPLFILYSIRSAHNVHRGCFANHNLAMEILP